MGSTICHAASAVPFRQCASRSKSAFVPIQCSPCGLGGKAPRGSAFAINCTTVQSRGCSSVDRVLASEAKGRGFDPRQPRQLVTNQPARQGVFFACVSCVFVARCLMQASQPFAAVDLGRGFELAWGRASTVCQKALKNDLLRLSVPIVARSQRHTFLLQVKASKTATTCCFFVKKAYKSAMRA